MRLVLALAIYLLPCALVVRATSTRLPQSTATDWADGIEEEESCLRLHQKSAKYQIAPYKNSLLVGAEDLSLLQVEHKTVGSKAAVFDDDRRAMLIPDSMLHVNPGENKKTQEMVLQKSNASEPWDNSQAQPEHVVEHVVELNNVRTWILMGAVVIGMSLIVVRLEVARAEPGACAEAGGDEPVPDASMENLPAFLIFLRNPWARLLFCFVTLQVVMLLWGIAQESVMTHRYRNSDGSVESFEAYFPILFNRCFSTLFFGCVLSYLNQLYIFPGFWWSGAPALTNACASFCQYESLKYVTFALQTTAKTTKLLPVVMINSIRGKKQSLLDYAEAITMVAAMCVFGLETQQAEGYDMHSSAMGLLLLIGLVCMDSLTPHLQDWVFDKQPTISSIHMMFSTAVISSVALAVPQLLSGSIWAPLSLIYNHPVALLHLTVLAVASAMVQYFLIFTVQQFGPVVVTIIVSIRQMLSVIASCVLFEHHMTSLAIVAMLITFFVVLVRTVRKPIQVVRQRGSTAEVQLMSGQEVPPQPQVDNTSDAFSGMLARNYLGSMDYLGRMAGFEPFFKVAVGIHVLYGIYAVTQEYLTTHTYHQKIFEYPLFLVALNHTFASIFAVSTLTFQGLPRYVPEIKYTLLPAASDFLATSMQHWALYNLLFPTQTLLKTLKIVPVMLIGRLFRSRSYSTLDYVEGIVITALVAFFVGLFQVQSNTYSNGQVTLGLVLMAVYIVADSFTSPLQDFVYQNHNLDPGQMLLGLEVISASMAWALLLANGSLLPAVQFLMEEPAAIVAVVQLAVCAAAGAYTCTLTVRLFGPAVFVLLMTSRQTMSLVVSVALFQHSFDHRSVLCLTVVCCVVLVSSIRRVTLQLNSVQAAQPKKLESQSSGG